MLKKNLAAGRSSPLPVVVAGACVAFFAVRTVLESESSMPGPYRSVNLASAAAMLTLVVACGAASTQSAHVSSPAPPPSMVSLTPLTAGRFEERLAPTQSLVLVLPEAKLWRTGSDGTYYHAAHTETASELWAKRWRQGEVVGPHQCAAQSALWRPDLTPPNGSYSQTPNAPEVVDAPPGYHTRSQADVWEAGDAWYAQLTATGVAVRECFTYVYRTRAPRSPLGRAVVTQRVKVMSRALAATRTTSPTVAREPAP